MIAPLADFHDLIAEYGHLLPDVIIRGCVGASVSGVPATMKRDGASEPDSLGPDSKVSSFLGTQRIARQKLDKSFRVSACIGPPAYLRLSVMPITSRTIVSVENANPRPFSALSQDGVIIAPQAKSEMNLEVIASPVATVAGDQETAFAINKAGEPVAEVVRDLGVRFPLHGSSDLPCHAPGCLRSAGALSGLTLSHGRRML